MWEFDFTSKQRNYYPTKLLNFFFYGSASPRTSSAMPPMIINMVGQETPACGTAGMTDGVGDGLPARAISQLQSDSVVQDALRQLPDVLPDAI